MKNYLKTGLLLILTIFLTGCVNVETNMDITMNKKMYFTIKMTIDKSNLEGDDIYKEELLDKNQKEVFTFSGNAKTLKSKESREILLSTLGNFTNAYTFEVSI